MKILLVDDDPVCLKILRIMFQKMSDKIKIETSSCREELEGIKFGEYKLICVDLSFPGCDGFEIVEMIRGKLGKDCPPIAIVTACVTSSVIKKCVADGMFFVSKPINKIELEAILRINNLIK